VLDALEASPSLLSSLARSAAGSMMIGVGAVSGQHMLLLSFLPFGYLTLDGPVRLGDCLQPFLTSQSWPPNKAQISSFSSLPSSTLYLEPSANFCNGVVPLLLTAPLPPGQSCTKSLTTSFFPISAARCNGL
jgi:hypothetical protein